RQLHAVSLGADLDDDARGLGQDGEGALGAVARLHDPLVRAVALHRERDALVAVKHVVSVRTALEHGERSALTAIAERDRARLAWSGLKSPAARARDEV